MLDEHPDGVAARSPSWFEKGRETGSPPGGVIAAAAVLVFFVVVGGVSAFKAWLLIPTAFDLGYFTSAIRSLPMEGLDAEIDWASMPVFGDHFSPIMILLAPLSVLDWYPIWLVVAQALAVTIAIWILWRVATNQTDLLTGSVIATGAALHPATLYGTFASFHMNVFGLPLLAGALAAVGNKRPRTAAMFGIAASLVREDLAVAVLLLVLFNSGVMGRRLTTLVGSASVASLVAWRLLSVDHGVDRLFGFVNPEKPIETVTLALSHFSSRDTLLVLLLLPLPWIFFRRMNWRLALPLILPHLPLLLAEWAYARSITYHYYVAIPTALAFSVVFSTPRPQLRSRRLRLALSFVALLAVLGPLGVNAVSAAGIHRSVPAYLASYEIRRSVAEEAREAVRCLDPAMTVAASSQVIPWLSDQVSVFHLPSPFEAFYTDLGGERVIFSEATSVRPDAIIVSDPAIPLAEGYSRDPGNRFLFWSEPDGMCSQ